MRRICIAYSLAVLSLAVVSYGKDADTISFLTVNEVEAARLHLRVKGIWKFVDEALAQGVAPPRMHSKYWVDKLPVTNQPQESAFRDFGYEVAVQLNGVSLEFYKHPSTDEEVGRVKRLLRGEGPGGRMTVMIDNSQNPSPPALQPFNPSTFQLSPPLNSPKGTQP